MKQTYVVQPEVKTKPLAEGIGRIMKKLILSFLLIGFVALSAFDSPKRESEKSKTEVATIADVTINTPVRNFDAPAFQILPSGAWVTVGFYDAVRGITNTVCGQDSNGQYYCCEGTPPWIGYCWPCGYQNTTCEK